MIHSSIRLSDDDEARSYGAEFTKKQEIESKGKPVDFSPGKDYYHWYHETEKVKKFYKKFFSHIKIPPDIPIPKKTTFINRIQFVPYELTIQQICEAYKKKFGDNQIFSSLVTGLDVIEPIRPEGDYVIGYFDEPVVHLTNLSYNDALETDTCIMNTKEHLVTAFMRRYEKGDRYDKEKSTILSTVVGGKARVMYLSSGGRIFPSYVDLNTRGPNMGYRIVELAKQKSVSTQ